jgi:hypothetical protein
MSVANYPHIIKEIGLPARMQSHPRTRVATIVKEYLNPGATIEDTIWQFPFLSLAEVHAALTYYYDNQHEIDVEIQSEAEPFKKRSPAN